MTERFPHMNSKQKEYCPSGYVWITNMNMTQPDFVFTNDGIREEETGDRYTTYIKRCRDKYGDVIITDGFDMLGRPLKHTDVAVYVPHPAIRRVQKTLRRLKAKRDIK